MEKEFIPSVCRVKKTLSDIFHIEMNLHLLVICNYCIGVYLEKDGNNMRRNIFYTKLML